MSFRLILDGEEHEITIIRRRPHLVLDIDGEKHEITDLGSDGDGRHELGAAGQAVGFARATHGNLQIVRLNGRTHEVALVDPFSEAGDAGGALDVLRAPMPGTVISLHCKAGDAVRRGDPLVTIESMKLQTLLPAMRDGTIAEILRTEGETFDKDEVIVRLETESEKA